MLDFGADGSGLFMKYLRRGAGYAIDMGASELVAIGSIELNSHLSIERIDPQSVTSSDGTELPADLIVYATGDGSMNGWLADLISPEVADRMGKAWGLGSGVWAPTRPKTPAPARASCALCASPRKCRSSGFTAASCTSRAATLGFWRCS